MTRFGMESPNLYQTCSMGYCQLVLKMEVIDRDLQCHFGHLLWIWARIAKFATKNLHLGVLSAGIEKGGYWPSFRHFTPGFQETAFSIALVHWSTGPPRGVICPKRALVSSLHRSDVDENGLMWVHADRPNGLMAGVWGSTGIIWWHHNPCHNSTSKLNRSPGSNRGLGNLKCGVVQGDWGHGVSATDTFPGHLRFATRRNVHSGTSVILAAAELVTCIHGCYAEKSHRKGRQNFTDHQNPTGLALCRIPGAEHGHSGLPYKESVFHIFCIPVKIPWIFTGPPLIFNGAPGNIQGNLTGMIV